MPNIIILHTEPIDYRMPFFKGIQEHYGSDCQIVFFKKNLIQACRALLSACDVRVVVVCGAHALGVPVLYGIARLRNARIVFFTETWNWGVWNIKTRLYRWIIGYMARHADCVAYPGVKVREWLSELGIPENRMIHVPNASFNYSNVKHIVRENGDPIRVVNISRPMKRKGLEYLHEAMCVLGSKYTLIGGHIDRHEVADVLARADVYVYPSIRSTGEAEAWGLAVNEALSAGIPVVATRAVAAVYDLIDEGVNGYIVDEGKSDALVEGIRRAVQLDRNRVRTVSWNKMKLHSFEVMSKSMCVSIDKMI